MVSTVASRRVNPPDDGVRGGRYRVPRVMHNLPMMVFYRLGDDIEIVAQAPMRGILVITGQTRISGNVGVQDGGEPSRQTLLHAEEPFLELRRTQNSIA